MAPFTDIARTGRKAASHRPWPRAVVGSDGWKRAIQELVEARATLLGLWGDKDAVHIALLEERSDAIAVFTARMPRRQVPLGRRASSGGHQARAHHPRPLRLQTHRRGGHEALARSRLLGRDQAARQGAEARRREPTLTSSCRWKERICTRSRSGPFMPASSSQGISASPPTARRWCASNSGSAMCTRASKLADDRRDTSTRARSSPPAPLATARWPMRSPSRRRWSRRYRSRSR